MKMKQGTVPVKDDLEGKTADEFLKKFF